MIWNSKFELEISHVRVTGLEAESKAKCQQFLADRVSARLAQSDTIEKLKEHMIEMETTGFHLGGLASQIRIPPRVKDWEIGEAIAEVVLEDDYEFIFPWPIGFDKQTPMASLAGADLVGMQHHAAPQFVFGQVKSSSENKVPPQVVKSAKDSLSKQMYQLRHSLADRQQLIGWLLVRSQNTDWESAFNEALQLYSDDEFLLVGVLASGNRNPNQRDLVSICDEVEHQPGIGDVHLLGIYLPFHKDYWADIVYEALANP